MRCPLYTVNDVAGPLQLPTLSDSSSNATDNFPFPPQEKLPSSDNAKMSTFLRGKQTGIERDLSASIRPELFTPDDQARYGINSQIRWVARPPTNKLGR